ncbi:MAG: hypothetical protein ACD_39C01852G0001 [uncultured bacterium]|nr:MAG: hypothetical protein ACD_39C01852G0001 [uncultured bacterium]
MGDEQSFWCRAEFGKNSDFAKHGILGSAIYRQFKSILGLFEAGVVCGQLFAFGGNHHEIFPVQTGGALKFGNSNIKGEQGFAVDFCRGEIAQVDAEFAKFFVKTVFRFDQNVACFNFFRALKTVEIFGIAPSDFIIADINASFETGIGRIDEDMRKSQSFRTFEFIAMLVEVIFNLGVINFGHTSEIVW